jgi:sugar lactone lactonase YvrE
VPGASVALTGVEWPTSAAGPPHVFVGDQRARVSASSRSSIRFIVPPDLEGGRVRVRVEEAPDAIAYLDVGRVFATGVHQVDNPAFDPAGRLYATQSGSRETKVPVPLYRIAPDGAREPLAVEIANPTSLAIGPDGALYVSSRFEHHVYRLGPDDRAEIYATDLGVPTGLAFDRAGALYVGDRSGTIFKVSPTRQVESYATVPSSVAAFHLAYGPDDALYLAAPTLSTHDPIYRIGSDRLVDVFCEGFGRPQGLAFDPSGTLYVVDALAGAAGLYRVDVRAPQPELVLTAPALVGVAFSPQGGLVVASGDTIWRLDV